MGDKACKHGEACGGTESKPECECDKYYEGDQCEKGNAFDPTITVDPVGLIFARF